MDLDDALRRLRAADPAAEVDGTWLGPSADAFDRDVAPERRRRPVLAGLGAAAVVAAVAVGAAVLHSGAGTPQPIAGPTAPTTSESSPPVQDPQQRTEALVDSVLAAAPLLPGAESSATDPIPTLTGPASISGSPNVIDHHAYWTAPGTVEAALAYLHSHPPDGLTLSGSASSGNTRTGEVGPQSLFFDAPDTSYARGVELLVAVLENGDGVAVRADAQAIWIPLRDPAVLLTDVTGVEVTVTRHAAPGRPGAATVTRTLDEADAQILADVVNALPIPTPSGPHSCPMQYAGTTDALDFATPDGIAHVAAELTGCGGVDVVLADGTHRDFESGDLDATLMLVLGLPADYGR